MRCIEFARSSKRESSGPAGVAEGFLSKYDSLPISAEILQFSGSSHLIGCQSCSGLCTPPQRAPRLPPFFFIQRQMRREEVGGVIM